ncbi:MAG: COX15/CtaA family protein, partial [Bacteroidota bacterium]
IQLILGGIMSGAKAALPYPSWPDMNGEFLPSVLQDGNMWTVENMVYYEATLFQPALIQFLHRMTAYALLIIVIAYLFRAFTRLNNREINQVNILLIILLITQISLGIATVVSSVGQVPVGLGVAHQFGAIALVGVVIYLNYCFSPGRLLAIVDK